MNYYDEDFFNSSFPLLPTELGHRYIGRWTSSKTGNVFKKCGIYFDTRNMGNGRFLINIRLGLGGRSGPPIPRNGVTMYHILEELEAWNN